MCGLIQAAGIAYDRLVTKLEPHGCCPIRHSPGIWKYKTMPTAFALCVNDFGVKHTDTKHAQHLINTLQKCYKILTDWDGTDHCALHLQWNCPKGHVDVSMPDCISKTLHKFQHPKPIKAQLAPHDCVRPACGAKVVQHAKDPPTSPILNEPGITRVQAANGTLLCCAQAVDPTMLPALNEISSQQACPTSLTVDKCTQLLDHAATCPNAMIRCHACGMVLHVNTDAACLVLPQARSRIAGHCFLSDMPPPPPTKPNPNPRPNGPIHTECPTLRHVVSSAAKAECGGLFHNSQAAVPVRETLIAMGHPQPPTPIKTDNLHLS
jgi:hypothetical protein